MSVQAAQGQEAEIVINSGTRDVSPGFTRQTELANVCQTRAFYAFIHVTLENLWAKRTGIKPTHSAELVRKLEKEMGEQQEDSDKGVHEINKQKADLNKEASDRRNASVATELLGAKDDKIADLLAILEKKKQDPELEAHRGDLLPLEYLNKHLKPGNRPPSLRAALAGFL
ncbi:hypothetical protein KJ359_001951 [Pestalotiopsis sp. 9143b]|nr:hypothetical protein KJ359_001951 [Pestalotiopsis sp. 9143b]